MSAFLVWTCDDGAPKVLGTAASLPDARGLWRNSRHAAISSGGVLLDVRATTADHHARAMERAAARAWAARPAPAAPAPFVPRAPTPPVEAAPAPISLPVAPVAVRARPVAPAAAKPRPAPKRRPTPPRAPVAPADDVAAMLARFGAIVRRAGGLDALESLLDTVDRLRGAR